MRLPRTSRILFVAAAAALVGAYFLPLWRIGLVAPQYPEGLGMIIRAHTITGVQPQDLTNINELNHYIGMKEIVPDAIPELRVMPWIIVALATTALGVAALGRRWLAGLWLTTFGVLGGFGLYDFWKWEYEYGHDLDPHAAISIPGMSYQPPLIGAKTLLNFVATSWPSWGGILCGVAFVLGAAALLWTRRRGPRRVPVVHGVRRAAAMMGEGGGAPLVTTASRATTIAVAVVALLGGCAAHGPRAIAYDAENCGYCRMTISDPRFGAELVSSTGRTYTFDSIECLASFAAEHADAPPRALWVSDYQHPGTLVPLDSAEFRRLDGPAGSPMGKGLVAIRLGADAGTLASAPIVRWTDVLVLARREAGRTPDLADAR